MATLKRVEDLDNKTAAIGYALKGYVAASEDNVYTLRATYGRGKAGRGAHYVVRYGSGLDDFFKLRAFSDDEALEKANKRLKKMGRD